MRRSRHLRQDSNEAGVPARAARGAVPPVQPRGAAAAAVAVVTADGVEVTQAIQQMSHSVPLVAGKRTVVRVYLSVTASSPLLVQGLLKVRRRPKGRWHFIRSAAPAHLDPAENGQLRPKRETETKSLNFVVPTSLCAAGQLEVALTLVWQTPLVTFLIPPLNARRTVSFVDTPPLRVRILGVRYSYGSPASTAEPSPLDYTLVRSWLERAYPVAEVQWSQMVVNGPRAWPFVASTINAFVRGIRMSEVAGGTDARTHYFGLVSDAGGANFMRGLASGIPTTPDPSTVASGPTGADTWGWDTDGSYGDWYTGHELGHTFGRFHAEFCGATGGAPYPFVNGQLANADGAFVGFDTGDAAQGLPMKALPGTVWHDVMTYCSSQWLSSFTYTGIRDRIVQEGALPAGATMAGRGVGRAVSRAGAIHVVATVNLTHATGQLSHVTAYDAAPAATLRPAPAAARSQRATSEPALSLRLYRSGPRPQEFPATFIRDACTERGSDVTGMVDALLPAVPDATRLELVLNGHVIDTFESREPARPVRDIRSTRPAARAGRRAAAGAGEEADAVIAWRPSGPATRAGRRATAAAPTVRYSVQVSTDGGATWQTASFGLTEPEARIDRRLFDDAETVRVRVVATDGFRRAVTEKTLSVSEL